MRILWLHDKLGAWGGAEANVRVSAEALRARGHENHLLFRERTGTGEADWDEVFATVHHLTPGEPAGPVVERLRPDVVWVHNWSAAADLPELVRAGWPAARMFHDHATYCLRTYKYHPLTRKVCRNPASWRCLFPCGAIVRRGPSGRPTLDLGGLVDKFGEIRDNRQLRHFVVASQFMREECVGNGFAADAITVLPPVPPERTGEPAEPVPGRFLFAGQLVRGKGVDVLIEALALLPGGWTLDVAGTGSAEGTLRELTSRLGLAERVTFHGHLPAPDLAGLFGRAQVVVFPSMWPEPFGLVGVEAMRLGRPVVAFDVGGVSEWLTHETTGLLVPWGSRPALAAALRRLWQAPAEARRLGENGRRIAHERFSFDGYVDHLEDYLKSVARSHRP